MIVRGSEVALRLWDPVEEHHVEHRALVRVPPDARHGSCTVVYGDSLEATIGNVESWYEGDLDGQSYWLNIRVATNEKPVAQTQRPLVGDSCWYRVWTVDSTFRNVESLVRTVGDGEHPLIDLMYIDGSGNRGGERSVRPAEDFRTIEGNTHWCTRTKIRGDR